VRLQPIDLAGVRFGRLIVLERDAAVRSGMARWVCRCDCGNEKSISGGTLRQGRSRSCGCLRADRNRNREYIDLAGKKFGRWTAISREAGPERRWLCVCECGTAKPVSTANLMAGVSKSCGCLKSELSRTRRTHGGTGSVLYGIWAGIKDRCTNPNNESWVDYGGRGIFICDEWKRDFAAFREHIGDRPSPRHSVDRIDNSRGYEPGNVRWATPVEQARNTRRSHRRDENVERIRSMNNAGLKRREIAQLLGLRRKAIDSALSPPTERQYEAGIGSCLFMGLA
jgi:hypothetical protein